MNVNITDSTNFPNFFKQLESLKYKRIIRTIKFVGNEIYDFLTEIIIVNEGNETCYLIPGEIYKKAVLVNFQILSPNDSVIQVSSGDGDTLNIKYLLYKLKCNISDQLIKKRLDDENLFNDLFEALWEKGKGKKSISELLEETLGKDIITKKDNVVQRYLNFFKLMDHKFVQFLFVKNGIKPFEIISIKLKNTLLSKKTITTHHYCIRKFFEYFIPLEIKKPYPLKGKPSILIDVNIPEKEKFVYYDICKQRAELKEISFNTKRFNIFHSLESEENSIFCTSLKDAANLKENNKNYYKIDYKNSRSSFTDNRIFIYFGERREKEEKKEFENFCDKEHEIKITRTLKNNFFLFYIGFSILSFILYFIFFYFNHNHYTELFIGFLITTSFDYINKTEIEKYYIKKPFFTYQVISILVYLLFLITHFFI